jgi:hypothetical protein
MVDDQDDQGQAVSKDLRLTSIKPGTHITGNSHGYSLNYGRPYWWRLKGNSSNCLLRLYHTRGSYEIGRDFAF